MGKLTPEEVMALLRNEGVEVSLEQAASVLEFLRLLADTVVSAYLKKDHLN